MELDEMASSLANQASDYLSGEMAVTVSSCRNSMSGENVLALDPLTIITGIGDTPGIMAAFSYSPELAEHLFQHTMAQLNMPLAEIPALEQELYRHGTLVETANVVIGQWLPYYAANDGIAGMSPPEVLEQAAQFRPKSSGQFAVACINTEQGNLRIALIQPRSLFEKELQAA